MCDYSLHSVESRPANVGDQLTTRDFGTDTRGLATSENARMAVCVMPGTELSFSKDVRCMPALFAWLGVARGSSIGPRSFGGSNKENISTHHDALEFPDGQVVLLTSLCEGQNAVVLQLPVELKSTDGFAALSQSSEECDHAHWY